MDADENRDCKNENIIMLTDCLIIYNILVMNSKLNELLLIKLDNFIDKNNCLRFRVEDMMQQIRGSDLCFLLLLIHQILPALGLTLQTPLQSSRTLSRFQSKSKLNLEPSLTSHRPPVLFPSDEELAVHLPDWKERGTRQAEYRSKSGITLKGNFFSFNLLFIQKM